MQATLFEAAAKEPAIFGILLASQTAFFAFLFSENGQLSQSARADSRLRLNVGTACVIVFIVGIGCDLFGLALNPPQPRLALVASGSTLILASCVGLIPLAADLADPHLKARLRNIGAFIGSLALLALILLLGNNGQNAPNLSEKSYSTVPAAPPDAYAVRADRFGVVLCLPLANVETRGCTPQTPRARTYRLSSLFHEDLRGGADYWDYSFTRPNDDLRFLYRVNPGQGTHWGVVRGETDQNVDFSKNKVYGLHRFGYTALAENVLEPQADDEGMIWAERGRVATATDVKVNVTSVSGFLSGVIALVAICMSLGAIVIVGFVFARRFRRRNRQMRGS